MTKCCENDLPSILYMSVFYCTFAFAIMLPNVSVGLLLSVSIDLAFDPHAPRQYGVRCFFVRMLHVWVSKRITSA